MAYFLANCFNDFVEINGLRISKSIHINITKKKELTGCVVGFLWIDILPPTSAELNNTLNKKKVFQILTEMAPKQA